MERERESGVGEREMERDRETEGGGERELGRAPWATAGGRTREVGKECGPSHLASVAAPPALVGPADLRGALGAEPMPPLPFLAMPSSVS